MTLRSYVFGIARSGVLLLVVSRFFAERRLRERHAIWWLVAGTLALDRRNLPRRVDGLSRLLGIDIPINLLFFTSIAILFLVSLQASSELTTLEAKTRILAERVALLEMRTDETSGLKLGDSCS